MIIFFRPEDARELAADVRDYDGKYAGRGQRFATAVERTLALIAEFPLAFPALYEPDIRSVKMARFPCRIVYASRATSVSDIVTRAFSGHATEALQHRYSTVVGGQKRDAPGARCGDRYCDRPTSRGSLYERSSPH